MDLDINANAGWLILAALVAAGLLTVWLAPHLKEKFPRAGGWIAIVVLAVLLIIALVVVSGQSSCTASAQPPIDRVYQDDATTLALARVCWSERDARIDTVDCAAIAEVTRTRATITGRSFLEQLRAYSPRATGARRVTSGRQAWVQTMRMDGHEPAGWAGLNRTRTGRGLLPLRWDSIRERWQATITEARSLVSHPRDACPGDVHHWGGSMDRTPGHFVPVNCGRAVNTFYRVTAIQRASSQRGTIPASHGRGDPD